MARTRMITRTVELNTYAVMTCNVETAEVRVLELNLGNVGNADPLKLLKKAYETDTLKLVAIQDFHRSEVLYGMPEEDFVKYAKPLPSRTGDNCED